jgi:ribosomal protein RSM22 (predicted rRNA methylase)
MKKQSQLSKEELGALSANVARLSTLLTRERDRLPAVYLKDDGLRKAYSAYFLPPNLAKIHKPLGELLLHQNHLLEKELLRIADIGCGPGSALLGAMQFFFLQERKPRLELTALDQVAENLKEAERFFLSHRQRYALDASLKTILAGIADLDRLVPERFDVIILSNVLNELFTQDGNKTAKRVEVLSNIMGRLLADDGSCIIIEPALRDTSRDLLAVRDVILERGIRVYAPCLSQSPCPALTNPKDWCHEDLSWEPPILIKELDTLTGLRKDSLKFSYLVLRKDGPALSDVYGPNAFRVVSEPLVTKGKREFYLCGAGVRKLVTRLDKDAVEHNHAFKKMKRGDVVVFERLSDEGKRFKVGKDTTVTLA